MGSWLINRKCDAKNEFSEKSFNLAIHKRESHLWLCPRQRRISVFYGPFRFKLWDTARVLIVTPRGELKGGCGKIVIINIARRTSGNWALRMGHGAFCSLVRGLRHSLRPQRRELYIYCVQLHVYQGVYNRERLYDHFAIREKEIVSIAKWDGVFLSFLKPLIFFSPPSAVPYSHSTKVITISRGIMTPRLYYVFFLSFTLLPIQLCVWCGSRFSLSLNLPCFITSEIVTDVTAPLFSPIYLRAPWGTLYNPRLTLSRTRADVAAEGNGERRTPCFG